MPMARAGSHWLTPGLLMQKFPAPGFSATVVMAFEPEADGAHAGLMVFGCNYAWLGLRRKNDALHLVLAVCKDAHQGSIEQDVDLIAAPGGKAHLRVEVASGAQCRFSFSFDGEKFTPAGGVFEAASSIWVGAKVGVFASAPPGASSRDEAAFQQFTITAQP
jgi:beta-xylosidase